MRSKGVGCLALAIPWFIDVITAVIAGEPADPQLAWLVGNFIWAWPLFGLVVILGGGLLHWAFGVGEPQGFAADDNFDRRRSKSFVTGLAALFTLGAIGLALAFWKSGNMTVGIIGALIAAGLIALVIKIADGAAVDRAYAGASEGADWEGDGDR